MIGWVRWASKSGGGGKGGAGEGKGIEKVWVKSGNGRGFKRERKRDLVDCGEEMRVGSTFLWNPSADQLCLRTI